MGHKPKQPTPTLGAFRRRDRTAARNERGEVTVTMILISMFAALAITVAVIVSKKVIAKAESIPVDNPAVVVTSIP